ncbi:Uncharacterized protein dnm_018430 [Desulfonema magnum]|uniref:Uncharacterized protein n=1 Tax=Desulfonema magnum TaxID=45655 RepID=A0A975GMG7_9BACT|nr:Uncharacterized protein dnm_018430 [Desulfonema magnum]
MQHECGKSSKYPLIRQTWISFFNPGCLNELAGSMRTSEKSGRIAKCNRIAWMLRAEL